MGESQKDRASRLMDAAESDPQLLADMLGGGFDPNLRGPLDFTALMVAAEAGRSDSVRLLLESGADASLRNAERGQAALHLAAKEGHLEIVGLFIDHGSAVDAVDDVGWTPLMVAAYYDHLEVVDRLLAAGADPSIRQHGGETAADIARRQGSERVHARLSSSD